MPKLILYSSSEILFIMLHEFIIQVFFVNLNTKKNICANLNEEIQRINSVYFGFSIFILWKCTKQFQFKEIFI